MRVAFNFGVFVAQPVAVEVDLMHNGYDGYERYSGEPGEKRG